MSWTKRQIVEQAYAELALAGYDFDLSPEETLNGVIRLDTMMATWVAEGLNFGYAIGLTPDDASLDDDSNLPLIAVEAVYLNLAIRISAGKGKTVAGATKAIAKDAKDALLSKLATDAVRSQQLPSTMPRGAGNRYGRGFNPFPDTGALVQNSTGDLDFGG